MELQGVLAVLEGVGLGQGRARQPAGLADRDEAGAESQGDRGGVDEPARLHADDPVHDGVAVLVAAGVGQGRDHLAERGGVGEEGRQVLEDDPGRGEVGDVDVVPEDGVPSTHFLPRFDRG